MPRMSDLDVLRNSTSRSSSPSKHGFDMIYICAGVQGKVPQTQAFANRHLSGMTQGRISDITLHGYAPVRQIAYSGYKDNIEAFLFATAVKTKVSTKMDHYPIPSDYIPTVPLPLPPIVLKFAKSPPPDFLQAVMAQWEKYGAKRVEVGQGTPCIVVEQPDLALLQKAPSWFTPRGPSLSQYAQLEGVLEAVRVYQCIDLFLATNTYFYKKADDEGAEPGITKSALSATVEMRVDNVYYRDGYTKTSKSAEDINGTSSFKGTPDELKDLTPHRPSMIAVGSSVLVAKPSPKPSSTSFGSPSSVPNHPGLVFPYFDGMLAHDTHGFRTIVTSHFLRNFGSSKLDVKPAYINFRNVIGTFVATQAGAVLTHVLKGIDLALSTQTHLYLLFDQKKYLGFTLLGEVFRIFAHGKWHEPLSATALRAELNEIQTHAQGLEGLANRLRECEDEGGDVLVVDSDRMGSMSYIADCLAKVKIRDDKNDAEELSKILSNLSFPTSYKTFKPTNITMAIDALLDEDFVFGDDVPFYIPLTNWVGINSKAYKIFASFGSRSFSFRNAQGVEIKITPLTSANPFEERDEKGQLKFGRLLVAEKVISECLRDWDWLKGKAMVKMDYRERAAGSRLHTYRLKELDTIIGKLREKVTAGLIGGDKGFIEPAGKRSHDVAFGTGAFDVSAL